LYLYYYCSQLFYFYYYEAESKLGSRNSKLQLRSSLLIFCSLLFNYKDPPIYIGMGRWRFAPKPLAVIFFRAPGGRGIYKKLLEPTQRPTNPYMGWATPPTEAAAGFSMEPYDGRHVGVRQEPRRHVGQERVVTEKLGNSCQAKPVPQIL
jgi:hypothetical protein